MRRSWLRGSMENGSESGIVRWRREACAGYGTGRVVSMGERFMRGAGVMLGGEEPWMTTRMERWKVWIYGLF